jgi:hypothetical protein
MPSRVVAAALARSEVLQNPFFTSGLSSTISLAATCCELHQDFRIGAGETKQRTRAAGRVPRIFGNAEDCFDEPLASAENFGPKISAMTGAHV